MTFVAHSAAGSEVVADVAGVEYHPPPNASTDSSTTAKTTVSRSPQKSSQATPPNASQTRLLGCRVDALVVAFKIDVGPQVAQLLETRAQLASAMSVAELQLGGFSLALKATRRESFLAFENADVRGVFDARAADGYRLELIARATYLATHTLEATLALLVALASEFGTVRGCPRLRRFDLAADFVAFPLSGRDSERFVTKRASIDEFQAEEKDFDEVQTGLSKPATLAHRDFTRKVIGFSISKGNPISARIYDKTAELLASGREEKREIEYERWRRAGWKESDRVTRVEFQHRGTFLNEVKLRDPTNLPSKLDEAWQHDAVWLRMVDPTTATRLFRCKLDPRWIAVAGVTFEHAATPILRMRVRGGATAPHMLGTATSRLAAVGQLTRIPLIVYETGEVVDEGSYVESMTSDDARAWVEAYCDDVYEKAAADTAQTFGLKYGWKEAMHRLLTRHNAAVARFTSDDDHARKTSE
ncbi:MAG TPA: hypothetical protein VJV78_47390 [Polyangiales bacterium]|nr:hypothetical protein [Polyangiales bacterium]